jgi:hypothetical protein
MRLFPPSLLFLFAASLASAETPMQPVTFPNGTDLSGWAYVTTPAADIKSACTLKPDGVVAVIGKPVGYLATTASYQNYRLHAEWRWSADAAKNSNSGVLLHIASGPKDRAWPICFQMQLKLQRAGDLLPMAGAAFAEKLSTPPAAKTPQLDRKADSSEKPLGEWNSCDIVCQDGAMEITVNGVLQNRVTKCQPAAGQIGFQLEGTPYELRNVRIEVLK